MNNEYTIRAYAEIQEVVCPKHRTYMKPLRNGFLSNDVYWCAECDCPYALRPVKMKQFDREAVEAQLAQQKDSNT